MKNNLGGFEQSLQKVIKKAAKSNLSKKGDVVFNFIGEKPIRVAIKEGRKTSILRTSAKETPRLEISGDPKRIQAILDGKKDPRRAFLEGSITVRGDLDYLQSVLRSLDLMD